MRLNATEATWAVMRMSKGGLGKTKRMSRRDLKPEGGA